MSDEEEKSGGSDDEEVTDLSNRCVSRALVVDLSSVERKDTDAEVDTRREGRGSNNWWGERVRCGQTRRVLLGR